MTTGQGWHCAFKMYKAIYMRRQADQPASLHELNFTNLHQALSLRFLVSSEELRLCWALPAGPHLVEKEAGVSIAPRPSQSLRGML